MIRRPPTSLVLRPDEITSFRTRMSERKDRARDNIAGGQGGEGVEGEVSSTVGNKADSVVEDEKEKGKGKDVEMEGGESIGRAIGGEPSEPVNMVQRNREARRGMDVASRIGTGGPAVGTGS